MSKRTEITQLLRDAERRGWVVSLTGGGHYRLDHPSGEFVFVAATPRTHRACMATKVRMRRIERQHNTKEST